LRPGAGFGGNPERSLHRVTLPPGPFFASVRPSLGRQMNSTEKELLPSSSRRISGI
jgi:hypothetical protein